MIEPEGPLSLSACVPGREPVVALLRPKGERAENLALMRRMDELHMDYPFYGSRQIGISAARVSPRAGTGSGGSWQSWGWRRPTGARARAWPRSTGSFPCRDLEISRTDHVWCADITYIPVTQGFFYLVAVTGWATRHELSWRLSNTMDASF